MSRDESAVDGGPDPEDRPEWWIENDRLREELGLSEYVPPRFADDVFTHDVVSTIESEYDVEVQFVGINTSYGDDWEVRVDGDAVLSVGRHRDENGNTVYEAESDDFAARLTAALADERTD